MGRFDKTPRFVINGMEFYDANETTSGNILHGRKAAEDYAHGRNVTYGHSPRRKNKKDNAPPIGE